MTTRRAFLAAIAGAVVAPHVRVGVADPEPYELVTYEWLMAVCPNPGLPLRAPAQLEIAFGWKHRLDLHAFEIPRWHVRILAESFAERCMDGYRTGGFIGV